MTPDQQQKWTEEFEIFADTEPAKDYCFGNYNNATRDEQVGLFCYLEARSKANEKLKMYIEGQIQHETNILNDRELPLEFRSEASRFIESWRRMAKAFGVEL